jgi:C4-dicarboxylate-specific signal transduction histidine kinase
MDSHPGALGQVVINLVNNAYVHAFEGRSDGLLKISAVSDGREVVLRFVDNGVGMSSETLENLMQPFFTTKMGKGGTGLGMSIVDNLVSKSLAGRMEVRSELGAGTSLTIHIPCVLPTQAAE